MGIMFPAGNRKRAETWSHPQNVSKNIQNNFTYSGSVGVGNGVGVQGGRGLWSPVCSVREYLIFVYS